MLSPTEPLENAQRLRKLIVDGVASPQEYLDLANLEAPLGRPGEGARILRRGVDECPEDAILPAQLGLMFARAGRAELAPNAFAVALERGDQDWIRRQAPFYEIKLGGHENADRLLASLLKENAEDAETLFVRALLRFAEGRYHEAWADYRAR